ncbi:DNA mismatch repair endonuclease MutL [Coleofasciculus sp. G2-EDA-02]|uniref:DNA mismatch repair endonuclease MutL n=1 Tax=Coleofasciculus sp. G2-EDA-02 TaxID=3069529 RepID=UPI003302C163
MTCPIQTLPTEVVDLIAAGEVIDSLAAVVRELVENSLDAGATRISVAVWFDVWRVRVADNGTGMDLTDLQKAASAHSTSKIQSRDDLYKITSLGFRGEALHSIAALAELEICSRLTGTLEGWRCAYNTQGETEGTEAVAIAPGTVVSVSNLFGKWRLRRQGLPSRSQQQRMVQATVQNIALCYPSVTWQVQQNDRSWFTISPGKTAQQIIPQLLKQVRVHDLQQLTVDVPTPEGGSKGAGEMGRWGDEGGFSNIKVTKKDSSETRPYFRKTMPLSLAKGQNSKLSLVLGLPDRCHRHRPDWVKVATNGRLVRSPELEQTILTAMARTLPRDRYPICFLHLQICPSQIDWNRHPAKAEIYLHSLSYWQEQISQAIEQALRIGAENFDTASQSHRVGKLLTASAKKGVYHLDESPKQERNTSDIGLVELKAVAQVRNMYILAEHDTGMWLIEQHIAHERVLYEQLRDRWQLVPLEPPVILNHLTPVQLEQLQRIELEIEPFGDHTWAVRNAPALLHQRDDCADALLELSLGGDLQTAQVATACRSAIRNGTPLTLEQMQTLLNQWKMTRHPRTCPHGRPIYLPLEESALARFFRRHWVIGKSHGI